MTLIECFTRSHVDNIGAALSLCPDKQVFVGSGEEMEPAMSRYRNLFRRRNLQPQIVLCDVQGLDFRQICTVLDSYVREAGETVIDLTGGDETVVMAVGATLARMSREERTGIRVETYDHSKGTAQDCIRRNRALTGKPGFLTVEELIALHGGLLQPDAYQPPRDCTCQDVEGLWSLAVQSPKDWNKGIMLLSEFESRCDSKMQIYLSLDQLSGSVPNFTQKEAAVRDLLGKLHHCGVIDDRSTHYALKYTYTSPIARYCTQKAGNVLEVKTLLEGRRVMENGNRMFRDCQMSVTIDWDGVVHNPMERIPETRNEIDVVLMHGMTPLFISCKNGNIGEEELYKLHTVATRFGGPYARKMLIATDLERKSPAANRAFIQRAWDMDIFLVTDAGALSGEEWQETLRNAVQ